MFKSKIHNLLIGNRFYGIEVYTSSEKTEYFVIEVLKKENKLSIFYKFIHPIQKAICSTFYWVIRCHITTIYHSFFYTKPY